ncbi:D-alanyl-D-alanine-carboxypeptidase/endopeptidase AmpH [Acuticoccus sediminis]|uniref:D-alanyl-D-alanine-carboxypeptidase/endopeptidase AmpH n=1 Tax=Acuticoccus sediminis TaxID=2184697 RepID=A0A8B2P1T8_9HYPH|nr:serine hydrolase [Acuticoccus sediminis]RAI03092.1 D-alanyl-D-alanine-carboxypeptidase/endopeptidase AmpH [Acuticoccus sediminis]
MLNRFAVALLAMTGLTQPLLAQDLFLDETVGFPADVFFISNEVPGMVVAVTRQGERAVYGFGTIAEKGDPAPNGDTTMRIGSITKVFTGLVLAHLVSEGTVGLTDTLQQHLPDLPIPERDHPIRLVDLVTHAAGFPHELVVYDDGGDRTDDDGVPDDESKYSIENYRRNLEGNPLLFAPGTGMLYSNIGFDLLGMALREAAGVDDFSGLVTSRVLDPLGLEATGYEPSEAARANMFTGHLWTGKPLPDRPTPPNNEGSSSLVTTANDMLDFLEWNLARFSPDGAEVRLLSQSPVLVRDALSPASNMDESGHLDAIALGWVVMWPEGDRPLILQKSGLANGVISYIAFSPYREVGIFIAINKYDFPAVAAMTQFANALIGQLAPR